MSLMTSSAWWMAGKMQVPDHFPRDLRPAALSGSSNKLALRLIDGKYVAGSTPDERAERYEICAERIELLLRYCQQKMRDDPMQKLNLLLDKVERSVKAISPVELDWCMDRLRQALLAGHEPP